MWLIGEFGGFFCFLGVGYGVFRGNVGGFRIFGLAGGGCLS